MDRDAAIARLFQYFVGLGTQDVLVAPDADPALAADAPDDALVFAPKAMAAQIPGSFIPYTVDPFDPREWTFETLGGLTVRREAYTEASFSPLTCPTVITVESADDLAHLVEDAELARETGVFADLARHPLAAFADQPALAAHDDVPGWLGRYLTVIGIVRDVRDRVPADVKVSGFGWRATESLPLAGAEAVDAPVLLSAGENYWVVSAATRQIAKVGRDVLRVVEMLVTLPDADPVEAVVEHLGVDAATAADVLDKLAPLLANVMPREVARS